MGVVAKTTSGLRVHQRWMIRRDIPEVLQIEQDSFSRPWLEEDFIRRLRERNCIGWVAELGERVVAFVVYELHPERLEWINFAVAADLRRRGIGRQLIEKHIDKLSSQRRTKISINVDDCNTGAHLFLHSLGFIAAGSGFDDGKGSEDAYRFEYFYDPDQAPQPPRPSRPLPKLEATMGMAQPPAQPQDGKRVDFVTAKKVPTLYKLEGDDDQYYTKLTQAVGMQTPRAVLAKVDGEQKASFFVLAGVRIKTQPAKTVAELA